MADGLRCDWRTGCSNKHVRELWYFCLDCGLKIPGSERVRCDFHELGEDDAVYHGCVAIMNIRHWGYGLYDPWSKISISDYLEAGLNA